MGRAVSGGALAGCWDPEVALLARLGQPAASGFVGAELESQAEPRFFRARAWSCGSLHPQTDRPAGRRCWPSSSLPASFSLWCLFYPPGQQVDAE